MNGPKPSDRGDQVTGVEGVLDTATSRRKDAEQNVKQWLLDLSNQALALFDRIDERGLQAADTIVTSDMRSIAIALDFGLREAIATRLMEMFREEARRGR